MIRSELRPDTGILIVTPEGPLEKADFDRLTREVDPFIESRGQLKGVMLYTPSFPGWSDFGALVAHLKFIRDHHRQVLRVAAVTESAVLSILPLVARHFVQAQVRHFDYADKDRALAWLTGTGLSIEVLEDHTAAARQAAAYIAGEARLAVAARGRFILALSGGTTPLEMLRLLAGHGVPWKEVQVVQVDERLAPAEDPDRNFLHLKETFLDLSPLLPGRFTPCPWKRRIWRKLQPTMPGPSGRSPVTRRSWTWSTWGWAPTATPLPWCPATRFLRLLTGTLLPPGFTRAGGASP